MQFLTDLKKAKVMPDMQPPDVGCYADVLRHAPNLSNPNKPMPGIRYMEDPGVDVGIAANENCTPSQSSSKLITPLVYVTWMAVANTAQVVCGDWEVHVTSLRFNPSFITLALNDWVTRKEACLA